MNTYDGLLRRIVDKLGVVSDTSKLGVIGLTDRLHVATCAPFRRLAAAGADFPTAEPVLHKRPKSSRAVAANPQGAGAGIPIGPAHVRYIELLPHLYFQGRRVSFCRPWIGRVQTICCHGHDQPKSEHKTAVHAC